MTNNLTHPQAKALAAFIATIRNDWDKPGIEHALGKAREMAPGPDLAIAAIKAAKLASNRTPSVIGMEGPHWRGSDTKPRYETPAKHDTCSVCYQAQAVCRSRWTGDHEFMPLTGPRPESVTGRVTEIVAELRRTLPDHRTGADEPSDDEETSA